jgi:hypothetical protein
MREYREPSPEEMLADPIVRALMEADGVDPEDVKALFSSSVGSRGGGALRKERGLSDIVDLCATGISGPGILGGGVSPPRALRRTRASAPKRRALDAARARV